MTETKSFFDAIKAGELKSVEAMVDHDRSLLIVKPEQAPSIVLLAMYYGQPAIADLLIECGAPLDFFEATACGRMPRLEELLKVHPDLVNAVTVDGFQPLGLACFFGQAQVAAMLLDRGARVNSVSRNRLRVMPLHSAVARQDVKIARLLLEHGADPNARQADDFTPLHGAAQNGQVEMVKLLLEFGAEVNVQSSGGLTPLAMAGQHGHQAVVDLLRSIS